MIAQNKYIIPTKNIWFSQLSLRFIKKTESYSPIILPTGLQVDHIPVIVPRDDLVVHAPIVPIKQGKSTDYTPPTKQNNKQKYHKYVKS